MLKNLPDNALHFLLSLYNRIWLEHILPDCWQEAIIIPIAKPGKDRSLSSSYRPISLTSCLCKIMERMVNRRLLWILEHKNLLTNIQCGFRKHRSTLDHLVSISTSISTSFVLREHLVAVFFDLAKAYDTTWRYGILRTLHSWGFKGCLPLFLQEFISNRSFRVRLGTTYSERYSSENGVPQGSILSVTLFAIAINSIVSNVRAPVSASLFVDDFAIYCSSSSISVIERQLQLVLNKLFLWSTTHGFTFSTTKSCCMHFCRKYSLHCDPTLHLGDTVLPFVDSAKFLGLIFDKRLTWRQHIRSLRTRCNSALNVLRMLSGTSWGADRTTLLRLYRALVRSILDYGSIIYGCASATNLRTLDTVHHAGIRLATGAFRTSRIDSLLVDAGEPSLSIRRTFLLCSYSAKISGLPNHPTYQSLLRPKYRSSYIDRPSLPRPPSIRLAIVLQDLHISLPKPVQYPRLTVPPWTLLHPIFDFRLTVFSKSQTCSSVFQIHFREILSSYPGYTFIYTDGSANGNSVACAFYTIQRTQSLKLHSSLSVFNAEKFAIYNALKYVNSALVKKTVICSDSLSALTSLSSLYSTDALTVQIQFLIHTLLRRNFQLILCWVPGHVGITGNELADQAAKEATFKSNCDISLVPVDDTKHWLKSCLLKTWQSAWDIAPYKLRKVKSVVQEWKSSARSIRREEIVLTRLRIGHCHLTHSFLFRQEPPPFCQHCDALLTVEHFLTDCPTYNASRARFLSGLTLEKILGDNADILSRLFLFLRSSGLYGHI